MDPDNCLDGAKRTGAPMEALLARIAPFSRASPAARASFAAAARHRVLYEGERAWRAGDPSWAFAFVVRGIVKLVRPRVGGRADILGIFGPGEAIGIVAALRGHPYPADALAASKEAEIVHIPRSEVLLASSREIEFTASLAHCCACRACGMRDMNAVLTAGGVEARLAALLLSLADRFGDVDDEDAALRVPVVLTRAELASCISSTMETVIRTMSRWDADGVVETCDQGFVIRAPDQLRRYADPLTVRVRKQR